MREQPKRKWLGFMLLVFSCFTFFSAPFQDFASLPDEIRLFQGSMQQLKFSLPVMGSVTASNPSVVDVNGVADEQTEVDYRSPVTLQSKQPGETELQLKVANVPIKKVKVNVLDDFKILPGGQSIGVQLHTKGVLVVGHHLVDTGEVQSSPGEHAKIKVGDTILKINDKPIGSKEEVAAMVKKAGENSETLSMLLIRGSDNVEVKLTPALDKKDKEYRMGLYIRDRAAGVGTLTFYDPITKKYGALGHVISDMDTGKPIIVGSGHIVQSRVTSIERGINGTPGEKFAIFKDENKKLGTISKNTHFGIFGKMDKYPENNLVKKPLPIALSEQVEEGPAQIYTVVEGQKIEKYDIEIVNVIQQRFPATKGMVIKVTDRKLLDETGGIVQGMSGSPIIQNDKIIGAVTHVFVNDPTSGYGLFIEWMLHDAGIDFNGKVKELKAS